MTAEPALYSVRRLLREQRVRDAAGRTDEQLLTAFVERRDDVAFEAIVRRHGPMALGVCRRLLRHEHDAEDAFQATFLVLARKATTVAPRSMLGNWLHGVARRTAMKARAANARRRERPAAAVPESPAPGRGDWDDWLPLLDRELARLPEAYRAVVVLCDLEGMTRAAAARHLGWTEGTVHSRLARGRERLAERLGRYGAAGAVLAPAAAEAAVPAGLVAPVVGAACVTSPTAAGVTASAAILSEGVLKAMLFTKLKVLAATAVVAAGGATAGWAFLPSAMGQGGGPGVAEKPAPAADAPPERKLQLKLDRVADADGELAKLRAVLAQRERELASLKDALRAAEKGRGGDMLLGNLLEVAVELPDPTAAPADAKSRLAEAERQRARVAAERAKAEAAKAQAAAQAESAKVAAELAKLNAELDALRAKPKPAPGVALPLTVTHEAPVRLSSKYTVELYPVGDLMDGSADSHNGLMQLIAMTVPDEESNRTIAMLPQVNAMAMSLSAEGHERVAKLFEKLRKMKAEQGAAPPKKGK